MGRSGTRWRRSCHPGLSGSERTGPALALTFSKPGASKPGASCHSHMMKRSHKILHFTLANQANNQVDPNHERSTRTQEEHTDTGDSRPSVVMLFSAPSQRHVSAFRCLILHIRARSPCEGWQQGLIPSVSAHTKLDLVAQMLADCRMSHDDRRVGPQ